MKRAVVAVIEDNNKVLLCQRSLQTRNQQLKWENPGGEVDGDETKEEAIVREVKEELGVNFLIKRILYENIFDSEDGSWQVTLFGGGIEGEPKALLLEETVEVRWFDKDKLDAVDLASYTREDFVRFGWIKK